MRRGDPWMGVVCAAAFALMTGVEPAVADDWRGDEPERAEAGRLEDHEASSEDLEDRVVGSRDMDVVGAEDPEDMRASSGDMEDRLAAPGDLERQTVRSRSLTNLKTDDDSESAPVAIEVPGQSEWEPATDPDVVVARQHLVRAQSRARNAIAVYGRMRRNDYPRGDARVRIIEERDAALEALEAAKRALAEAERG